MAPAGAAGLPGPAAVRRTAAAPAGTRIRSGADCEAGRLNNATALGLDLALSPGPEGTVADFAYAIYSLSFAQDTAPQELRLHWDVAPQAGDVWVGLAHATANAWRWFEPAAGGEVSVGNWQPYLDAGDQLLVAVLLIDGGPATLHWVRAGGNAPPLARLTATPEAGSAPASVSLDASASIDLDGSIAGYAWDWYGDGTVDTVTAPEAATARQYLLGGHYAPQVQVFDAEGASAVATADFSLGEHAPWWRAGYDRRNTRQTPAEGPGSVPQQPHWDEEFLRRHTGGLIGPDGTLYFLNDFDYSIHAWDPAGTEKWALDPGDYTRIEAIGPDGTLYCNYQLPGGDGFALALNPDKSVKWEQPYNTNIDRCVGLTLDGQPLYWTITDHRLHCLDPVDGAEVWYAELNPGSALPAAVGDDGSIYVITGERLQALTAAGAAKWPQTYANAGFAAPLLGDDGTLYCNGQGWLRARNPDDGSELWHFDPGGGDDPTCYARGYDQGVERIYFSCENGYVYCLRPESDDIGRLAWRYNDADTSETPGDLLIDGNQRIYFGYINGDIYCLKPNKNEQWVLDVQLNGSGAGQSALLSMAADGTMLVEHRNAYGLLAY
jgi:outer membrane protein assembly factor BamB